MAMKTIGILGAGYIGLELTLHLAQRYSVRVMDRNPRPIDLPAHIEWWQQDMMQNVSLADFINGLDALYYLLYDGDPVHCQNNMAFFFATIERFKNIMSHWSQCINHKPLFVFTSSAAIYGAYDDPCSESTVPKPINYYGLLKLTLENMLTIEANSQPDAQYTIVRLANPYGSIQALRPTRGFINRLLFAIEQNQELTIGSSGEMIRDFIHMVDIVQSLEAILSFPNENQIYNLSSGIGYSLNEVVSMAEQLTRSKVALEYSPGSLFEVPINILDNTKLKQILAIENVAFLPIAKGLELTLPNLSLSIAS